MDKNDLLQFAVEALALELKLDSRSTGGLKAQQWDMGGQCVVYKVDIPDGRCACLKLEKDDETTFHLERESHFLRSLGSKHFPRLILDAARDGFIVEEWVEGVRFSLENRLFLLRNLKVIGRELAQVLQDLTATTPAVLHRDIKPRHLRFREGKVMVLDFGSAEHEGARAPVQPDRFPKLGRGTHVCQPFEQLTSQPTQDRRVDVFAAASVIFAIMKGRRPYDNAQSGYAEALDYYKNKERELYQVLESYPPQLQIALFDALRVDPRNRSPDLWDVVSGLEQAFFKE